VPLPPRSDTVELAPSVERLDTDRVEDLVGWFGAHGYAPVGRRVRRHLRGSWHAGSRLEPGHGVDDFVKNAAR
jgi:hypothetical protein